MLQDYIRRILAARVYDVARITPLDPARKLGERLGCEVRLKREDLQDVFSFKLRGAYNRIARLSDDELARGVVTASAGNHAQGVALAARHRGTRAYIVMGNNTPEIKIEAVRARGGKVILHGDAYDDAAAHARTLAADKGLTYVHPFDDPDVIAGQGTVGVEILNQHNRPLHAIFAPVGGGGLVAGIAAYVKYLRPEVRIIGVEAEGAACMAAALAAGRRVRLKAEDLDLFADGAAVAQAGKETFRIARRHVDEVITVSVDEICAAIKDIFDDTRAIAEPAGALAVAGMKKYVAREGSPAAPLVAVVSGANVNFDRLRHVSERAETGEQREMVLGVTLPERPGAFRQFCRTISGRAVTEFNYRYSDAAQAQVFVGLQMRRGAVERGELLARLEDAGYPTLDLTDNEMAKLHVRHMVGGRAPGAGDELLFRFEFPERQGALLAFLAVLGERWNISMFHYRNHGAAWGRVLAGFQAGPGDRRELRRDLDRIGYRYWEETDNPAYLRFLR